MGNGTYRGTSGAIEWAREAVVLRTDGGLKTGRDVVMAAMLSADEFGIGLCSQWGV